jgi:hypothetical protein
MGFRGNSINLPLTLLPSSAGEVSPSYGDKGS